MTYAGQILIDRERRIKEISVLKKRNKALEDYIAHRRADDERRADADASHLSRFRASMTSGTLTRQQAVEALTMVEMENTSLRARIAEMQRMLDLKHSDAILDSPGYHHQIPSDRDRY